MDILIGEKEVRTLQGLVFKLDQDILIAHSGFSIDEIEAFKAEVNFQEEWAVGLTELEQKLINERYSPTNSLLQLTPQISKLIVGHTIMMEGKQLAEFTGIHYSDYNEPMREIGLKAHGKHGDIPLLEQVVVESREYIASRGLTKVIPFIPKRSTAPIAVIKSSIDFFSRLVAGKTDWLDQIFFENPELLFTYAPYFLETRLKALEGVDNIPRIASAFTAPLSMLENVNMKRILPQLRRVHAIPARKMSVAVTKVIRGWSCGDDRDEIKQATDLEPWEVNNILEEASLKSKRKPDKMQPSKIKETKAKSSLQRSSRKLCEKTGLAILYDTRGLPQTEIASKLDQSDSTISKLFLDLGLTNKCRVNNVETQRRRDYLNRRGYGSLIDLLPPLLAPIPSMKGSIDFFAGLFRQTKRYSPLMGIKRLIKSCPGLIYYSDEILQEKKDFFLEEAGYLARDLIIDPKLWTNGIEKMHHLLTHFSERFQELSIAQDMFRSYPKLWGYSECTLNTRMDDFEANNIDYTSHWWLLIGEHPGIVEAFKLLNNAGVTEENIGGNFKKLAYLGNRLKPRIHAAAERGVAWNQAPEVLFQFSYIKGGRTLFETKIDMINSNFPEQNIPKELDYRVDPTILLDSTLAIRKMCRKY